MTRALLFLVAASAVVAPMSALRTQSAATRIRQSSDVAWLERVATDHDYARTIAPPFNPKALRADAYVRLGAIATPASLAAIRRVEAAARAWSPLPAAVSLIDLPHPSRHMGDRRRHDLVATVQAGDATYGVLAMERLGGCDLFLTSSRTPSDDASWTRPLLLPGRAPYAITDPALVRLADGRLRFDGRVPATEDRSAQELFHRPRNVEHPSWSSLTIDLADVGRDADGDGWTDIEERRLGTNPQNPDSDADGLADGQDVTPLHAPSPLEPDDEEALILQKVFFAGVGIHGSYDLLLVRGSSRPVQLWGSRGPVLYGRDRTAWFNEFCTAPPLVAWRMAALDRDHPQGPTATVEFSDYIGPMAAAGYTVILRKIDAEWFVVNLQMNWIS